MGQGGAGGSSEHPQVLGRCCTDTQEGWQGAAFENKLCLLEEINVGVMAATCVQL